MDTTYYGETSCTARKRNGEPCHNKAYYVGRLCGVHGKDKTKLPVNPMAKQVQSAAFADHAKSVETSRLPGRQGNIILMKMRMMHKTPLTEGYLSIYPNYNDGNKKDGLGLPSLSPKAIGPVHHGQPGLPPALNLENLHQGNKCFKEEIDVNGPTEDFYRRQREMYSDPKPWRHKFKKYPELQIPSNKNIPEYSVWTTKDNTKLYLTYLESRQIYCTFYERHTINNPDFLLLKKKLADGYNLQICGYDAYQPEDMSEEGFKRCYKDTTRPFGHELVLCAMLLGYRPWIDLDTVHPALANWRGE